MSLAGMSVLALATLGAAAMADGSAREPGACTVRVAESGSVSVRFGRRAFGTIEPGLFEAVWQHASMAGGSGRDGDLLRGTIRAPGGTIVDVETRVRQDGDGARFTYRLTPRAAVKLNSLHVNLGMSAGLVAGGSFTVDGETGALPAQLGQPGLRSGPTTDLTIAAPSGRRLRVHLDSPTPVLIQDDRQWGSSFSVRIGPQLDGAADWPAGKPLDLAFRLSAEGGVTVEHDGPVTVAAGAEWIPLETETDIEPGSALDFSAIVPWHTPAGSLGRVRAVGGGRLAFERKPDAPARFYGVNLCFSAQYLTHEQSDRLAERLKRMGYNAVRFHHYESELVDRSGGTSVTLNPEKLDQLDYLFAALKKRGIYMTTDLFVSRPVFASEVWPGANGDVGMDEFKMAVPVNERAFANFKAFSVALLTHRNPYTQMRWADDPALAWLSLINEGNPGNFIAGLSERCKADWARAWKAWIERKYPSAAARSAALGGRSDIPPVPPPDGPARITFDVFLAENQADFQTRSAAFLKEIGCPALLTNLNAWTNPVQMHAVRAAYDYVDDHFYVDHPEFIEQPWRLPSKCPNTSPVADGAPGGRGCAFIRLFDKPFTVSEYNYSGPGRFRGVGGILTGALGAIQDWSVLWRFAWGHNRATLFEPAPLGYFDVVTDPLNLAAERASICMFRRGDLKPAPHSVVIEATTEDVLKQPRSSRGAIPGWTGLAWVTRVGYATKPTPPSADRIVLPLAWADPTRAQGAVADPFEAESGSKIVAEMRRRGWLKAGNPTSFEGPRFQTEHGQLTVDGPADVLTIDTPMTAGGYAQEGGAIRTQAVTVRVARTDATVWVSSLDGSPIASSKRMLVTHLTDLQNTGIRYADRDRRTLVGWGELPHLVLDGAAEADIRMAGASKARVWALSMSGKRLAQVQARVQDGALVVPLAVNAGGKARMLYEIEVP
jgi:hypothetical protein